MTAKRYDDMTAGFDRSKFVRSIRKAHAAVEQAHRLNEAELEALADEVAAGLPPRPIPEEIRERVELRLLAAGKVELTRAYVKQRCRTRRRSAAEAVSPLLQLADCTDGKNEEENR